MSRRNNTLVLCLLLGTFSGSKFLSVTTHGLDPECIVILWEPYQLCATEEEEAAMQAFKYGSHSLSGTRIPYRLFVPEELDPNESYPLVLTLHGLGEHGDDNERQIQYYRLATAWAIASAQKKQPAFVVSPQWDETANFHAIVVDMLDSLSVVYPIDQDRIYLAGFSMGAHHVLGLASAYPDRFAAGITAASCCLVEPDRLGHFPIWGIDGTLDSPYGFRTFMGTFEQMGRKVVRTEEISQCELAVSVANGADLLYSEIQHGNHYEPTPRILGNPLVHEWLMSQRRGRPAIQRSSVAVDVFIPKDDLGDAAQIGIVGNIAPLGWQRPFPLCDEANDGTFGADVDFASGSPDDLEYKFVRRSDDGSGWIDEPLTSGLRSGDLTNEGQVLPLAVWGREIVTVPDAPGDPIPPDDGSELADARLVWQPGQLGGRYDVEVSTSADFSNTTHAETNLRDASFLVGGLTVGQSYFWRVRATNPLGASEWAGPWRFTVAGSSAILLLPEDNATEPVSPTLSWTPYPRVAAYTVQRSIDSTFASTIGRTVQRETFDLVGLDPGQKYFWRVRPSGAEWSEVRSFVTMVADRTMLVAPPDGAAGVDSSPALVWSRIEEAHGYQVQISSDSDFGRTATLDTLILGTSLMLDRPLSYSDQYFWRVRAAISTGYGGWSQTRSFTVSTGVATEADATLPTAFALHPAYPNPFNPTTTIAFDLPEPTTVRLTVFGALGRRIESLVNSHWSAGRHRVTWKAEEVPSGVYFVRMNAGDFSSTDQIYLLK